MNFNWGLNLIAFSPFTNFLPIAWPTVVDVR